MYHKTTFALNRDQERKAITIKKIASLISSVFWFGILAVVLFLMYRYSQYTFNLSMK